MNLKYFQRKKKESHTKMETVLNTFIPLTPAKPSPPPQRLKLVYHRRILKNKNNFSGESSSERCLIDLNAPPPRMEYEDGHKEPESFESCLSEELEPLSQEPTMPELCGFEVLQAAANLTSPLREESSFLPKELEPLSQETMLPELGEFEVLQIATDQTITEEFSSLPKELEPLSQELTVPELGEFEVLQAAPATDPNSAITDQESSPLPKELEPLSQELTVPELGEFEVLQTATATDPISPITEESRSLPTGKFILVHCEDPVTPCLPPRKQKFKQKRRKHVPKVLVEGKKKKTPLNPPKPKKKTNSMLKEKNVLIPKKSVRIPACRKSLQFETVENGNNREIFHTENNGIAISAQDCQKANKLGLFSLKWKRKNKRMARQRKVMLYSILWSVIPRTLKTYQPYFLKKKKRSKLFQQRLNLASTAAIFPQTGTQVPQTRCEVLLQSQNLEGDKLIFQDSQLMKDISFPSNADLPTIESELLPAELRQDTLQYESKMLRDDKLQFFINEFLGLNISGKNDVNGSSAPVHYSDLSPLVSPKFSKNREEKELALVPYLNGGELATLDSTKKRKKKKRVLRHELPVIAFDPSTLRQLELIRSRSNFLLKSNGEEDEDEGWEKQRKLFAGRVKLFIDKMKYMQGDRSFKPWKGSVVDSIVGVYLTQNVSDTLSSNVYMQLLAKFPLQTVAEYSLVSHEFYMRPVPLPWTQGETETEGGKLEPSSEILPTFELEPCQEISILEAQLPGKLSFPMELSESSSRKRTADGDDNDDETKKRKTEVIEEKEKEQRFRWERLRRIYSKGFRTMDQMDSADWEAVRCAKPEEVSDAIHGRGQHTILAMRIQNFLNLVVTNQNGSMDLEWLRNAPPEEVKEFLLGIDGLGLKSVECLRLLSLQHIAFPVDVNVARITVRLGWVPLQPLPGDLQFHALEEYPILDRVQEYLWPRLHTLDQKTLYELHYQMITFGKVFCTKRKPNCSACPMREECRHYASATASGRFALPRQPEEGMKKTAQASYADMIVGRISSSSLEACSSSAIITGRPFVEMTKLPEPRLKYPTVEMLMSPEHEKDIELVDIEDLALDYGNHTSITRSYNYNYNYKMDKVSDALVNILPSHYSIPMPKVKDIADLRTVHLVFELPDHHPILHEFERHEPDDPFPYLFAIWSPGETESSMELPVPSNRCSMGMLGAFCDEPTCYNCNKIRQQDQRYLRGTILIPCRTAMRGSFPLNGTYFQVTEVLADDETSKRPIDASWDSLRGCNRSFVCIGSSISAMLKGLSADEIRSCFLYGYICVRGFDRKTRQPRPLSLRLHAAPSKRAAKKKEERNQAKAKTDHLGML